MSFAHWPLTEEAGSRRQSSGHLPHSRVPTGPRSPRWGGRGVGDPCFKQFIRNSLSNYKNYKMLPTKTASVKKEPKWNSAQSLGSYDPPPGPSPGRSPPGSGRRWSTPPPLWRGTPAQWSQSPKKFSVGRDVQSHVSNAATKRVLGPPHTGTDGAGAVAGEASHPHGDRL